MNDNIGAKPFEEKDEMETSLWSIDLLYSLPVFANKNSLSTRKS
jgi:hypothetical protein